MCPDRMVLVFYCVLSVKQLVFSHLRPPDSCASTENSVPHVRAAIPAMACSGLVTYTVRLSLRLPGNIYRIQWCFCLQTDPGLALLKPVVELFPGGGTSSPSFVALSSVLEATLFPQEENFLVRYWYF